MKKIVYVDMDGVIADFESAILNISSNVVLSDEDDGYESRSKIISDLVMNNNPRLFEELLPIEDSIFYVNKLFDKFEVYFLSTPMWDVVESYTGKRIWLEKQFGEKAHKKLILSHRKDLCFGDFLIDDRTRNGAGEFKGELIHFGTNKFPNWETVYNYLINQLNQ